MKRNSGFGWLLVLLPLGCIAAVSNSPPSESREVPTLREAVSRSLPYLMEDGQRWMEGRIPSQEGSACVSCHHVPFALWSLREAEEAGLSVPTERLAKLEQQAVAFVAKPDVGRVMIWTPMLLGSRLSLDSAPSGVPPEAYRDSILSAQEDTGSWKAKGQFPGQKRLPRESDAIATLWTLLALSGFEDTDSGTSASLQRAMDWVEDGPPGTSNEFRLARLLAEDAMGEKSAVREYLRELLASQGEDGGWSFAPDDSSNAFSTGQTLYALRQVGLEIDHGAIRRGVAYLLNSQKEDGTWAVSSKLTSKESSADKDYIYEYWGTAWAVIGLSRVLAGPE